MFKREKPRVVHPSPRYRRARLLAPAALAAVLAGGADAAADEGASDAGSGDEEIAALTSHPHLRHLAAHPDGARRFTLAALLPELLVLMTPIERVEVVAGWATSRSPHLRLAIARALRHAAPEASTPGSLTAIEHLADDPDPLVRAAVAEAAWLRRGEDPKRLMAVLARLADDEDRFVRDTARLALGDA